MTGFSDRQTDDASVGSTVNLLAQHLSDSDTSRLDAQVLLAHILDQPRAWILAHPESQLTPPQKIKFNSALNQLKLRVPLPYIIGHWEFYGLEFIVNSHVLIPRPETELLIEQAIPWLQEHPSARHIADIGTGSGCIAVTLAKHIPDLYITATDISEDVLQVAQSNAEKHNVADQIEFFKTNLLNIQPTTFNLICANLPYIPTKTLHTLDVFEREPTLALDGGPDGLDLIRELIVQADRYLVSGGLLLLEIEATQGKSAIQLVRKCFQHAEITLLKDLAGHERLVRVQI